MIAEKNGILKKIQVKYVGSNLNVLYVLVDKSGPNGYRYTYCENDIDWFVVYHEHSEKIAWIKIGEALVNKRGLTIRLTPVKNGQKKGVHLIENYSIDNFIKDFN